jgi:hypothetical protein
VSRKCTYASFTPATSTPLVLLNKSAKLHWQAIVHG